MSASADLFPTAPRFLRVVVPKESIVQKNFPEQEDFMMRWNAHQAAEQAERAAPQYGGKWPPPKPGT